MCYIIYLCIYVKRMYIQYMWQYMCDHNSEKTISVFIFLHCYKREENFLLIHEKQVHLTYIMYLCYFVKFKQHIS